MQRIKKNLASIAARLHSFSETIAAPPPGRPRLIVSLFICAYLLWQISVPLTYYLGHDRNDERFAWRMFSVLGWTHKRCTVTVNETIRSRDQFFVPPQDLEPIVQNFLNLLARNRAAVIKKFLNTRCSVHPDMVRVRLLRTCPMPDGSKAPAGYVELNCVSKVFRESLATP